MWGWTVTLQIKEVLIEEGRWNHQKEAKQGAKKNKRARLRNHQVLPWWNFAFHGQDKYPQPFICCIYQTCLLRFILMKDSVYTWLPMSVQTSPQLSLPQTVNTLNKWNRRKAEANRYPLQKEMWYDHFSYLEGLENGRHCETASVICHISFKSIASVGLKNGERSTPQRAINQALSSVLSCFSSLFGEKGCHVSVGADTPFGSVSFHSLWHDEIYCENKFY